MRPAKDLLIFLVDDDKMFLKSLEHYIQRTLKKITIKTFSTGEECLSNMHQKPDIILLDYILNAKYLDAMNGIKVLDQIKTTDPDSTVIIFSAQDHIDVAVDIMKHGAFDYIVKNDKIFVRLQNVIKNVLYAFSLKDDMLAYKRRMRVFGVVLVLIVIILIYMRIYFQPFLKV